MCIYIRIYIYICVNMYIYTYLHILQVNQGTTILVGLEASTVSPPRCASFRRPRAPRPRLCPAASFEFRTLEEGSMPKDGICMCMYVYACMYVCLFVCMCVSMCVGMDGWMDGWMSGWVDGWMDG